VLRGDLDEQGLKKVEQGRNRPTEEGRGIRDESALAKLPADERAAFTQLWADVAALLKKAEVKPK